MNAETNVVISIRNAEFGALIAGAFCDFIKGFISPCSAEIHLPGREVYRFPWSLDFGHREIGTLPDGIAGEVIRTERQLTYLEQNSFGNDSRYTDMLKQIELFRIKADRDCRAGLQCTDELLFRLWGACRIAVIESGTIREGWFLRQRLESGEFEPICLISLSFGTIPLDELVLDVGIRSAIWSRYSSYDYRNEASVSKPNFDAERRNAEILANAVSNMVLKQPEAIVRWGIEREHQPDLSGFIPDEFCKRFGEPGSFRPVKEMPMFAK